MELLFNRFKLGFELTKNVNSSTVYLRHPQSKVQFPYFIAFDFTTLSQG